MKYKNNRGGINPIILILLILIAVMLVVISIPASKAFRYDSEARACQQAIKSASDGLIIEYLDTQKKDSIDEARNTILKVMPGRKNICPSGGNIYLILNSKGIYEPVCGLHCPDKPLRTRLNASYALNLLKEAHRKIMIEKKLASGASTETENKSQKADVLKEPESITITVNSKKLECVHVTKEEVIHRGTATTNGYEGVVAFYGVAGDFTFSGRYKGKGIGNVQDGDICYFLYADEDYCAIWRSVDGWDGDAYTAKIK